MYLASVRSWPPTPVFATRSEPARSTKWSLACRTVADPGSLLDKWIVKMQWERVEAWFMGVYKKDILENINRYKFVFLIRHFPWSQPCPRRNNNNHNTQTTYSWDPLNELFYYITSWMLRNRCGWVNLENKKRVWTRQSLDPLTSMIILFHLITTIPTWTLACYVECLIWLSRESSENRHIERIYYTIVIITHRQGCPASLLLSDIEPLVPAKVTNKKNKYKA